MKNRQEYTPELRQMVEVVTDIINQKIDLLIDRSGADPEALIGILQDIQSEHGYLPLPALKRVSERLNVPYNRVWAVATFYEAFKLEPGGRVHIMVCTGTACHVNNARDVMRVLEDELMIEAGQTTPDGEFSLETVHCLGGCAIGPVVVVDGKLLGHMNRRKAIELLNEIRSRKGDQDQ